MPLLRRHKRADHTSPAFEVGDLFDAIPRSLVNEVIAEIALSLPSTNTGSEINPASFKASLETVIASDPTISHKVRAIGECVLRDLLIRQARVLRSCNEALAATGTPELEQVKADTEARLQDLADAHRQFRHSY